MYKIIYRNTFYGDEEIDTADNRKEAIKIRISTSVLPLYQHISIWHWN